MSNTHNGVLIALIHDDGQVGMLWKKFMEDMFTVELPENYRDMGLDVECFGVTEINDEQVERIDQCSWKLFLLSQAMLDDVKNSKSVLITSNILNTQPQRVIILILAEQNDVEFHDDVRRSLCVFRDFPRYHLVYATNPGKIFSDLIEIVSPLYIVFHPNSLSLEDRDQHLTLIANKAYPTCEGATYIVEFDDGKGCLEAPARLFNPCTLLLQNPGLPTGVLRAKAYICVQEGEAVTRTQLGEPNKVWVQSDLDKLNSMLEKNNNPFQFLCQALNVDPNNPAALDIVDKHLTESFRKHVPENQLARVFGTDQGIAAEQMEERSNQVAPTLLHFAAMHGLRNLTAQLLRCPGAVRAYGMANCDGDYPTNLAEKSNHWDLKSYMNSYMEVSAMVDSEMGSSQNTSEMVAQMVSGQFISTMPDAYNEANGGTSSKVGYVSMKPVAMPSSKIYDTPFIVPIPSSDNTPNYESILAQMIECPEDTYMSLEGLDDFRLSHHYGMGYGKEAPPRPPRDLSPTPEEAPPPPPKHSDEAPPLPPLPPSFDRNEEDCSIRRGGADRVSYGSLSIPKVHSYVSPAQSELIALHQKVKNGELTTNQAVIRFQEWERKHKEQPASFQLQQECLQRLRNSLMKSREIKRSKGESDQIEITKPILAGSSTYDLVLKKTNDADPSEVIYGTTKPQLDDGFSRTSSRSEISLRGRDGTTGTSSSSMSSNSSVSSNVFGRTAELYAPKPQKTSNVYGHKESVRPPPVPPREAAPPCVPHRNFPY